MEYDELPSLDTNGVLSISGATKNGVRFRSNRDLGIQIYFDPPPQELTRGQVSRTYCYDSGRQVAALREPLTGGSYWTEDEFIKLYSPCPNPYDVSPMRRPRDHTTKPMTYGKKLTTPARARTIRLSSCRGSPHCNGLPSENLFQSRPTSAMSWPNTAQACTASCCGATLTASAQ